MSPPARVALLVCVPSLAILSAACGASSSNSDDSAPDSAADAATPLDADGVDSSTTLDAGPSDSTVAIDASANDGTAVTSDAPADGPPLADVATVSSTACTLQSGSRIKIRWYESPDGGARIFDSMYDTVLDASCAPAITPDGTVRCLPVALNGGIFFADPSCSTPIYQQSDYDCTTPPYVGLTAYSGYCAAPTVAVYKVGDRLADAGMVYQGNATDCEPQPYANIYDYYALAPVADSAFVGGTAGTATAGYYSIGTVDFNDGARYCDSVNPFVDTRTQFLTQVAAMPDGTYRMLPASAPSAGFADSTCTTPATMTGSGSYESNACAPVPPYTEDINGCTEAITMRAIGAPIDAGWVTQYAPDAAIECVPSDPLPEGGAWNALSDPVPPSTFDLVETLPSGTGRVQELAWATDGGFRFVLADQGYDSQLGTTCSVTSSPAASASCFPPTPFAGGGLYTDGTCTTPLNLVTMPSQCIPSGFPAATTIAYVSGCPAPRMVHVGASYTGPMWQKVGNTCNDVGFPDDSFWSTIDDIDPSTFPQLTAVVE